VARLIAAILAARGLQRMRKASTLGPGTRAV